jgi:hypothetical protein
VKVKDKPTAVALIPYLQITFNQLSRLLGRHNIKCIAIPPTKISDFLPKIKDDLGLRTPRIYSIPCECGKVYIGQTGRLIEYRIKEHQRNTRPLQTEKSALAEHSLQQDHKIWFQNTKTLSKTSGYMEHLIMEAIQVEIHPNNLNREDGLRLSTTWKPILKLMKR